MMVFFCHYNILFYRGLSQASKKNKLYKMNCSNWKIRCQRCELLLWGTSSFSRIVGTVHSGTAKIRVSLTLISEQWYWILPAESRTRQAALNSAIDLPQNKPVEFQSHSKAITRTGGETRQAFHLHMSQKKIKRQTSQPDNQQLQILRKISA